MKNLLSQSVDFNGQEIKGPLVGANGQPIENLGQLVSRVLSFLLPLAGVILLFVLIWGGYDYMMSQGNPEKVKTAQAKITTGIIGFGLLIFSYLLVRLIAAIFGLQTGII
ncbi:hypothetical protein HZA76_03120 [Candidatus Roizmanbacteria bacterium]|nr:hypothetical protein [Candidatus Roizmanbacteria bacterium]